MDRITVKKIIETNLKKGKLARMFVHDKTLETYNKVIDSIDNKYKLKVCLNLSQLDTPTILVGNCYSSYYPVFYCFNDKIYIHINSKTVITSDVEEAIETIEKCFY
jgi:hypothetical protein